MHLDSSYCSGFKFTDILSYNVWFAVKSIQFFLFFSIVIFTSEFSFTFFYNVTFFIMLMLSFKYLNMFVKAVLEH